MSFDTGGGQSIQAVRGISLEIEKSGFVGLVGESGSGKSVTASSILGLLPATARVGGTIEFDGVDLPGLGENRLRELRGREVSMIFQNPMSGLNPVLSIGHQMKDSLHAHQESSAHSIGRALELLDLVGLPDPRRTLRSFPHELSGGMQQRVMIAMAIAHNPRLLIADEPTTALDVTIQAQIMEVLEEIRKSTGTAVLLITHDLGLVAGSAEQVYVMYQGQVFESGKPEDIFYSARSPYTQALLNAQPGHEMTRHPNTIDTLPIEAGHLSGCAFRSRCPDAKGVCRDQAPPLLAVEGGSHHARCLRLDAIPPYRPWPTEPREVALAKPHPATGERSVIHPVMEVRQLVTTYKTRRGFKKTQVSAVDGVSLEIWPGETLSVVGESGSGKTTLGRTLTRLVDSERGEILLDGEPITAVGGRSLRTLRRSLQIVFQDPYGSLNPRMTARQAIREPLLLLGRDRGHLDDRVEDLARQVGLPGELLDRRPAQLSGGQLQRVGIARAIAVEARLIVLDEPVSALDLSIQAEILRLLAELQETHRLSYLFITHDLSVTRHISDRVAVMYLGRIVEIGSTVEIFDTPAHPYTQALLSAVPIADPEVERGRARIVLEGERPNPANPPSGCRFRTRCPIAEPKCAEVDPVLESISPTRSVACHFPLVSRDVGLLR